MSEERHSEVLGALPRARPQRRSEKRAPAAGRTSDTSPPDARQPGTPTDKPKRRQGKTTSKPRLRQPAQPAGTPFTSGPTEQSKRKSTAPAPARSKPAPHVVGTAVGAAAELAEIGLSASARALRQLAARLPRV